MVRCLFRPREAVGGCRLGCCARLDNCAKITYFTIFFLVVGEEEGQFESSRWVLGLFKPAFDLRR